MPGVSNAQHPHLERHNIREICMMERKALEQRTFGERIGDQICAVAGRMSFVLLHLTVLVTWIIWNNGLIPGLRPFDPFPYPLMTMWASLEGIFLALFILISQNRASRQSNQRAHLDLQINLLAELESTKTLQMLRDLCEIHGLPIADDPEVQLLSRHTDPAKLVEEIRKSMPDAT